MFRELLNGHSFCTPPRALREKNIPRFRGKLPGGSLLSRAVLLAKRSHYDAVDFEVVKLKNLKRRETPKMEENLQELVFHTRLLLLTFREFHMSGASEWLKNLWEMICV